MERKKIVSSSILRQSNGLSKFLLGFVVLLLLICTSLNEVKMVNSCITIGCTNHAKPGSWTSFHAFSHKNSELFQMWIQAVKRKKLGTKKIQPYL